MAVDNFHKTLHRNVWQNSEYPFVSEFNYIRVLNMRGLHRVLNLPEYAWIISKHAWICLNMPKYVLISLNLPEWLLFYFPIVYLNAWLLISMFMQNLKLYSKALPDCFLEKTKLNFFYSSSNFASFSFSFFFLLYFYAVSDYIILSLKT